MSSQSWQSILKNCAVENIKAVGFSSSAEDKENDTEWMKSLSTKENIFYGGSPYMPILIENIPNYIELDDFEFERIKEIQTVGVVYGEGLDEATLFNHNQNNQPSIQLSFRCCTYENLSESGYCPGLKMPCKLYGRLISIEGKPLIEIHRLTKINDLDGSLKTISMLSQIVRQKYHYYVCSPEPQRQSY